MPPALLDRVDALIARPHGIILVTGPTGSGKAPPSPPSAASTPGAQHHDH
jgi:type II secretory pathway predicted ATPase ExeA